MAEVGALTFDVYGTLLDWKKTWSNVAQQILSKYGSTVNANEFIRAWKSKTHQIGLKNFEEYVALLPKGLAESLRHYDVQGDPADAKLLINNWGSMKPFPDVPPALRELKAHFALAIISNTDNELLEKVVKALGVHFDVIVTSEIVKAYKPIPKTYQTALQLLGCKPHEAMHVAGSQYDISGAKSVGMRTAWVNRAGEKFQEKLKPDYEVSDLIGLVEILVK